MRKTTDGMERTFEEAVIIATRNRPDDLCRTLESVARQEEAAELLVVIVDGSNGRTLEENKTTATQCSSLTIKHLPFPDRPAATRQRNHGIDHLPKGIEVVHFLDDDVTVLPGYFEHLRRIFHKDPRIGGAGGMILRPDGTALSAHYSWLHRLFLLTSRTPGRVLLSGQCSPMQTYQANTRYPTQWLITCAASFRRAVFGQYRFDERVVGAASPRLEDLDFSYRVGRQWMMVVEPRARLIHHTSPRNRREHPAYRHEELIRRYWFVEKNLRHPLAKPAFWWAVLGRLLALSTSRSPEASPFLRATLQAVLKIISRDHPVLQP